MKRPPLLLASLALNALLVLTVAWKWRPDARISMKVSEAGTSDRAGMGAVSGVGATPDVAPAASDFHWSQLDTSAWTAYRDSLRRIGCPAATIREILEPLVRREYAERARGLAAPYIKNFWELLRPPTKERLKGLETASEAIRDEERQMIEKLFGSLGGDERSTREPNARTEAQWAFLPPGIQERTRDAWTRNQELVNVFSRDFRGEEKDRAAGFRTLQEQLDSELASFLTPEELTQIRMRRSRFVGLRDLEGVNLSESELAELIRLKERTAAEASQGNPSEAAVQREHAAVEQLLGPERSADFVRAQNPEFQSLLLLTDRLGASADQARELWAAHEQAGEAGQQVIKDVSRPDADRKARLDSLRAQLEVQAETILGGERGRVTWERLEKSWLNQTFQLPEEDPLRPPP